MGRMPEQLRIELHLDRDRVPPGAAVTASLVVVNTGMSPVDATRPSARVGDALLWRGDECLGGHGPFLYAQMVVPDLLQPGDQRELVVELVADLPPGDYEVRGWYDAMSGPWPASPVRLTVRADAE